MQRATEQEKEKARLKWEEQRSKLIEEHEKQLEEERKSYNVKMREGYQRDNEGEHKRIRARQELMLDDNKVHIALAGESGAGKSSLLNGLRGIKGKNTPGYAAEDSVQSKRTKESAAYECASKFSIHCIFYVHPISPVG